MNQDTGGEMDARNSSATQAGEVASSEVQGPGQSAELAQRFNDDLLIDEADRHLAKSLFPGLYHVLDHPALREEFVKHDHAANQAKTWVNTLGLTAVVLATMALLASALAPLLEIVKDVPEWVRLLLLGGELLGLMGTAIAVGGVLLQRRKRQWLHHRFMTEMLRNWHFQLLVCRGKEIENSCDPLDPRAKEAFLDQRDIWFADFKHHLDGKLASLVQNLVDRPEAGYQWLHQPRTSYAPHGDVLEMVFEAYRRLRFEHQAHYTGYKLRRSADAPPWRFLQWPVILLQRRTEAIATFCLVLSILISSFVVVGRFVGWSLSHSTTLSGAIISLMILNVATRAIQDGLALPEEAERYSDYAGKVFYLLNRFQTLDDRREKLQAMEEMERAALEELKSFLRSHSEARFIV